MSLTELETELKGMIIETLELEDLTVADIDSNDALFNEGLGVDSIDALELGVALHNRYGIKLDADVEENRQHFASVGHLARFVSQHSA